MPLSNHDIDRIAEQSPLVKIAADHICKRTQLMFNDQKTLAMGLKANYEEGKLDEVSGERLQKQLLSFIDAELGHFQRFDTYRGNNKEIPYPYQIRFHKMEYILKSIREELADESHAVRLVQGQFQPHESSQVQYPMLRTNTYWGSNRGTLESAKWMCARFSFSQETVLDYRTSSIAHWTPCSIPVQDFSGSRFLVADAKNQTGFGVVHGGYAFGGQRLEATPLEYGPEDCSTFVCNVLESVTKGKTYQQPAREQCATRHMLQAWRTIQTQKSFTIDPKEYPDSVAQFFKDTVSETISSQQVQPGDILVARFCKVTDGDPDSHSNGGGHTGIVIGADPEAPGNVLIFDVNRDMERENPRENIWGFAGFGIESFPGSDEIRSEAMIRRTMYLRSKHLV